LINNAQFKIIFKSIHCNIKESIVWIALTEAIKLFNAKTLKSGETLNDSPEAIGLPFSLKINY